MILVFCSERACPVSAYSVYQKHSRDGQDHPLHLQIKSLKPIVGTGLAMFLHFPWTILSVIANDEVGSNPSQNFRLLNYEF